MSQLLIPGASLAASQTAASMTRFYLMQPLRHEAPPLQPPEPCSLCFRRTDLEYGVSNGWRNIISVTYVHLCCRYVSCCSWRYILPNYTPGEDYRICHSEVCLHFLTTHTHTSGSETQTQSESVSDNPQTSLSLLDYVAQRGF